MQRKKAVRLILIFIIAVVIFAVIVGLSHKNSASKERYNMNTFFGVLNKECVAIMVDEFLLEEQGFYENDNLYMSFNVVTDYICERFFWDEELQCILFVKPEGVQRLYQEDGYIIKDDCIYMSWNLVTEYAQISQEVYSNPNRIIIRTANVENTFADVNNNTEIRYRAGLKSPILKDVKKGEQLKVLDTVDDWTHVVSADGCIGYIKSNCLDKEYTDSYNFDNMDMVYPSLSLDKPVCLGWHQMSYYGGNSSLKDKIASVKGLNVISPTWFYLTDDEGNVESLASADYVDTCHNLGIQVWALIENFTHDVNEQELLSKYSKRQKIINTLINECLNYNIDGINVDFEELTEDAGEGYIQFIRELSVECHKHDIILSVDNYVPYNFNSFYARKEQAVFADYVIVMSYDEHRNEETGAGSVASLTYVDYAIGKMLEEVPKEKLINAVPFYTRLWIETPKSEQELAAESATDDYQPYKLSWQTIEMYKSEAFVNEHNIELTWDAEAGQNYGEYVEDGTVYKIWIEDANSIEEKIKKIQEYDIAGMAAWTLGFETTNIWDVIERYYPE